MNELRVYAEDPVGFVSDVLGAALWSKQAEILEAVRDCQRVTVRSCHGVGKSFSAACAVLWRLHCFRPSIVLTTAPGHRQVKDVLWRQIRALQNRARVKLPGEVRETAIKIAEDTFALGFATDEGDRFQGFHSPHLFIVVDEAAGVSEAIYEAMDGCLTTEGARLLLIGNPTRASGRFAESHRRPGWRRIHISAFDSPNLLQCGMPVDTVRVGFTTEARRTRRDTEEDRREFFPSDAVLRDPPCSACLRGEIRAGELLWPEPVRPELVTCRWVWEKGEEWGTESPIYQARVLGEFPDLADDTLFPLSWLDAAAERAERRKSGSTEEHGEKTCLKRLPPCSSVASPSSSVLPPFRSEPVEIGVDVARYGS